MNSGKNLFGLLILCLAAFFNSCSNDGDPVSARLNILLVDEPADYQEVNVEILGVSINYGSEDEKNGWEELETSTGIYNLLDLTAGNEVLLVSNDVPAGEISQIRLLLGENNSVLVDEEEYDLKTPSGQESGVKLNLKESFTEGIDYTIILDFDAARSVIDNPVKYILKPVIRANLEALNGAIEGVIDPNDVEAVVYAIQEQDTIATTYPDETGKFLLRGIPEGSYTLSIDLADDVGFEDYVENNISVTTGNITDLESIKLEVK